MIIIPGQGGTYRHLRGRVTGLLAESGLSRFFFIPAVQAAPVPGPVSRNRHGTSLAMIVTARRGEQPGAVALGARHSERMP
jgi:hypothetical protein